MLLTILKSSSNITYIHSRRVQIKKNFLVLFCMAMIFAAAAFASPPDKQVTRDVAVSIGTKIDFNMNAIDAEFIGIGNTAIAEPATTVERHIAIASAQPILAEPASDYQPANYVSVIAGTIILDTNIIQTNVVAYNPRDRTQALARDQGCLSSKNNT